MARVANAVNQALLTNNKQFKLMYVGMLTYRTRGAQDLKDVSSGDEIMVSPALK